ncbi:RINT1-like protein MAG2 isoform X2 [Phalaenopsis equestris]|uniref:RINT1-like protein MAG2 isoform X2 n=1 Tax=Phalaenopsis equestris TaxID=78828 RepID=UPI0009E1C94C|nr:RINT1-like protein MAG2 isoform X2 [Phalaenopsis equestris]
MELDGVGRLPRPSDLSPPLLHFLNDQFKTSDDLSRFPNVELEIRNRCSNLEAALSDLSRRLSECLTVYAAQSNDVGGLFRVREALVDLRSRLGVSSGEEGGVEMRRGEQILGEELRALAREVARVEAVRAYAETALKLDSLVGDVEDAVSSSVIGKLKSPRRANSEETHQKAINSLKQIEDILSFITKARPRWARLVSAVDHRIDKALAILRPQAIADHRSLLSSLGWPPPLSGSSFSGQRSGKSPEFSNPLLTMEGELKGKYCVSFLSLCDLQELQFRRKVRQLEGYDVVIDLHQPLWVIEELVNPISLASQAHFSKWVEKPEFIFALVFKITRDFVDSMDDILQPWVDKARLVGYSCREEWISAMVTALSTYLAKEIFPKYTENIESESLRSSWLQLIDLMISFDKRMQSLLANSGLPISLLEGENQRSTSALSVFCDRPDWLDIWVEIELFEMLERLKSALQSEKNWKTKLQGMVSISGTQDYKSPVVSSIFLQCLSLLIDRAKSLPTISLRSKFIKLTGSPIIQEFIDCLLRRCQESEGLTALADDDAMINVSYSINAARYCESTLTEWCEDLFFLEIETAEGGGIFEEVKAMKDFQDEWSEKISTVLLRGFDARCRDYLKNKKQWQEKSDESRVGLKALITALDYLQDKISKLEGALNVVDFTETWRRVASGVDQILFNGVIAGNTKFSEAGVRKFEGDIDVLFGVFSAWCLRPGGFFPRLSEGLRLLKMEEKELGHELVKGKEKWLKEKSIRNLTLLEVEKLGKNRIF